MNKTPNTRCNDEIILMMAFRGHANDCLNGFYDNREMEINAAGALCRFAMNHKLLDTCISAELMKYIKAKGYTEEVRDNAK